MRPQLRNLQIPRSHIFFSSFNLLIGWQLPIWNCCKPFISLLYNCQLLCFWRLALSIAVKLFPRPFFRVLLLQGRLLQNGYVLLYALSMSGVYFFNIFKNNFSSFALWKTSSFVILSVHFIFNISFLHHVSNAFTTFLHFFLGSTFLLQKEQHSKYNFLYFFFISKIRLFELSSFFLSLNTTLVSLNLMCG